MKVHPMLADVSKRWVLYRKENRIPDGNMDWLRQGPAILWLAHQWSTLALHAGEQIVCLQVIITQK